MSCNIIIVGAAGRMGKHLVQAVQAEPGAVLTGAVEIPGNPAVGADAGITAGLAAADCVIRDRLQDVLKEGDTVIDFTQPDSTIKNLKLVQERNAKAVIGTTGLSAEQAKEIQECSSVIPVVFASNMSVGMNLLFRLVRDAARILGNDYDIEIVEAHHRYKKDAPSGSAKTLAEAAAEGRSLDLTSSAVYGREGMPGERGKEEIGIHAVRAGDIVGDHTVLFSTLGERVELRHQAHSRNTFAKGAVRAALWMAGKPAGLYNMQDVLGLK